MEKETRVGVMFNGKMTVCSVTKYTTCDDVTEMVLYSSANRDSTTQFALFETAHGVERMLAGKSSILKVIRSWGSKKGDVSLLVKQVDWVIKKKIKLPKAMKKLEKIRSLLWSNKMKTVKSNTAMDENLEQNLNKPNLYDKSVKVEYDYCKSNSGKIALMKRYLNDIANHTHTTTQNLTHTTTQSEISENKEGSCTEIDSDLDTAFIDVYCDVFDITEDKLNDAIVADEDSSDTESAFYESYSSEDDLERNVFEDDIMDLRDGENRPRDMFARVEGTHCSSYDRAMESFMGSLVSHHDNDEGLSSMESDVCPDA